MSEKELTLSKYQKNIIDYFKSNPHSNMLVSALAGSGKTTLLKLLSEDTTTQDVYLAFNNTVSAEFKEKIKNPKTKVYTLHALGFAIMNACSTSNNGSFGSAAKPVLDNLKIYKILDSYIYEQFGRNYSFDQKMFLKDNFSQLYNLVRLTNIDIQDDDEILTLSRSYGLFKDVTNKRFRKPTDDLIVNWIQNLDRESMKQFERNRTIDFTDMLYITVKKLKLKQWEVPYFLKFTNIYLDECQDMSNLQLQLTKYIKRPNGRYVCVGDYYQSCYAFNGANSQAFNLIPKMFAPMETFELPINYRCPTSVIEYVNNKYDIPIQARPDAPDGEIKTINKEDISKYIHVGDMVISRKNKWFSSVIIDLVKAGIPVYIQDKELLKNLLKLIKSQNAANLNQLLVKLNKIIQQYEEETARLMVSESENPEDDTEKMCNIIANNDKIDNIDFVHSLLVNYVQANKRNYKTVNDFVNYITNLLGKDTADDSVRITSIHKAKGLEAPQVFVLNEAKICKDNRNNSELNAQEMNLSYISVTRPKEKLFLVKEPQA